MPLQVPLGCTSSAAHHSSSYYSPATLVPKPLVTLNSDRAGRLPLTWRAREKSIQVTDAGVPPWGQSCLCLIFSAPSQGAVEAALLSSGLRSEMASMGRKKSEPFWTLHLWPVIKLQAAKSSQLTWLLLGLSSQTLETDWKLKHVSP